MATVVKDFKVKNGLIVEGSTATVNNFDVLTKKQTDQDYIVGLIGGTSTSANTANTVVKRDGSGDFAAGTITASITGNVTGNVTGTVSSLSNHDTADLAEGTNLYFSNARALAATASAYDVSGAAAAAQSAAISAAASDATSKANAAQAAAIASSSSYTDNAVAALVDSAPAALNTLNELAAALADNVDANGLAVAIGNKLPLAGGIMTGAITLSGAPSSDLHASTKLYVDEAKANAIAHADALDTDDVAEGTAQYFTSARAKTEAAALLTSATLTNITITGSGSGLTITAENGVADSNTDNLVEGSSNLYFSNARAVTALEAVVPDFTAIEINNVAKQIAARATVATASTSTAASWAKADYRSGEFLVKIANGSHTDVSKVILTLDTSDNVAITEYAMVGTNGSLGSVTADVSGNDVRVRVTTANNNSDVMIVGTILK